MKAEDRAASEVGPKRHRSICFVAPAAYPVLARDRTIPVVGGAEVQQVLLAREFARRGWRVSMICMDFGQPDGVEIDGVTVYRIHTPHAGLPLVRFVHPRFTSLWAAMRRADADVYYQRAVGALTGFVAAFARLYGRLSIFAGAHDLDFDPALSSIRYARDRHICRWGLLHVDAIVTQSARQQLGCLRALGRPSTMIRSCYAHSGTAANKSGPIIWVGSLVERKRPEMLVELAKLVPQRSFKMVGGGDAKQVERLRNLAVGVKNLEFTGFVPYADVENHFDEAAVLINTSSGEGFPNTFLQAWSRGMPTLSFFDPAIYHEGSPVALCASDVQTMVSMLTQLLRPDDETWQVLGARCRNYAMANHSVDAAVDAYEALLSSHFEAGVASLALSR